MKWTPFPTPKPFGGPKKIIPKVIMTLRRRETFCEIKNPSKTPVVSKLCCRSFQTVPKISSETNPIQNTPIYSRANKPMTQTCRIWLNNKVREWEKKLVRIGIVPWRRQACTHRAIEERRDKLQMKSREKARETRQQITLCRRPHLTLTLNLTMSTHSAVR
jgi:hypothetical protein